MASEFDLPIVGLPKKPVSSAVAQTTALTQTPEEQPPTSEFDLPIVNKKPLDQQVTRIKKEEQIPFESLYKDPENLKVIREYGEVRFGESGKQKKGESDEDYAKRFMTAMRQVEWNTSLNAIPELNWINNASQRKLSRHPVPTICMTKYLHGMRRVDNRGLDLLGRLYYLLYLNLLISLVLVLVLLLDML